MRNGLLAGLLAGVLIAAVLVTAPAIADAGRISGGGGGSFSLATLLAQDGSGSGLDADKLDGVELTGVCQLLNTDGLLCTHDNTDGTPDVRAATNDEYEVRTSGTGTIVMSTDVHYLADEGGTKRVAETPMSGCATFGHVNQDTAIILDALNTGVGVGDRNDRGATVPVAYMGDGLNISTCADVRLFEVYGEGAGRFVPGDALALTVTTDTASTPLGSGTTGAGTACRMSSASGVTNWTPSETGAVNGMFFCCTNTGTNNVTMLDSDGVYEGPGSVVGQWDQVCMEYVTDRWVQRSFSDNEP